MQLRMSIDSIPYLPLKNVTLTEDLDSTQKADMRAYMSLVNNVLGNAEVLAEKRDGNLRTFLKESFFMYCRATSPGWTSAP